MSKQYLQTTTIPDSHRTDIFSIATTPTYLFSASGGSSITIHSTKGQVIHPDTPDDENPYPLVQILEKVHLLGFHHVCTSLDGNVAASCGFGGEVKVWELAKEADGGADMWKERATFNEEKSPGEAWALALTQDGQYLAATTHDGRINVYDTCSQSSDRKELSRIAEYKTKGSFAMSVDISSDGEKTASGHQNGNVYIFNNSTQRLAHSLAGLVKPVRSVRFSPGGTYIAAAGDARVIAVYDARSGEQVASLSGHGAWITALDWNHSGELLLSGAHDGKAKVWSVERRECVATLTESEKGLWCVRWLPSPPGARTETFVTAGAAGTLAFYREASGT